MWPPRIGRGGIHGFWHGFWRKGELTMTTFYGYLRLSDEGMKHFDDYVAELKQNGATEIVTDKPVYHTRPKLDDLIANSEAGDRIIIKRITHLSANLEIATSLVDKIEAHQITLVSLEPWERFNPGFGIIRSRGGDGGGNGGG